MEKSIKLKARIWPKATKWIPLHVVFAGLANFSRMMRKNNIKSKVNSIYQLFRNSWCLLIRNTGPLLPNSTEIDCKPFTKVQNEKLLIHLSKIFKHGLIPTHWDLFTRVLRCNCRDSDQFVLIKITCGSQCCTKESKSIFVFVYSIHTCLK